MRIGACWCALRRAGWGACCFSAQSVFVPAPGLRLRGAVPPKEHNHEVSGNSDTDRVRNLDLPTSTGSTIAAALGGYARYVAWLKDP